MFLLLCIILAVGRRTHAIELTGQAIKGKRVPQKNLNLFVHAVMNAFPFLNANINSIQASVYSDEEDCEG